MAEAARLPLRGRPAPLVSPTLIAACVLLLYLSWILARAGGDPLELAQLGEGFANGQPVGEPGYDGQFNYWIARDPTPAAAAVHLDVPAYRYQRLLYPLLARWLAAGQAALIPWTLLGVNLIAHLAGTYLVEQWLVAHGWSRWYALAYGLWPGLLVSIRLDLSEPLCFALIAGAWLAWHRGRLGLAAACLGLALLAKETALLFWAALLGSALLGRRWRAALAFAGAAVPLAALQVLLLQWFGAAGLATGGHMATPLEWIPYMGLWRVAGISLAALALLAAIWVPMAVLPSVAGLVLAIRRLLQHDFSPAVLALAAHAAFIAITPFSTFREPLGMLRLLTGLLLSLLLFGSVQRSQRALLYSQFWLAALALLLKE